MGMNKTVDNKITKKRSNENELEIYLREPVELELRTYDEFRLPVCHSTSIEKNLR